MAQQITTNTFGVSDFVVSADATQGTHTTIASALSAASSGDTIFVRPGTYTENLTLVAGVTIVGLGAAGDSPAVTLVGNQTATFTGRCTISNVRLQTNTTSLLTVSGTSATVVFIEKCFLNITQTPAITYSSTSASSAIYINDCFGDISVTNKALVTHTASGWLYLSNFTLNNSGNSTLPSGLSGGFFRATNCMLYHGLFVSGSTAQMVNSELNHATRNTTVVTISSGSLVGSGCSFYSGSSSPILRAGGTIRLSQCTLNTSNALAVNGALEYSDLSMVSTGHALSSGSTGLITRPGIALSDHQPSFMAYNNTTRTNITGSGVAYTVIFDVERYDIGADYNNSTGVFTAPYTGKYIFTTSVRPESLDATVTNCQLDIVTSNNTYTCFQADAGVIRLNSSTCVLHGSAMADMDAGDTAFVRLTITHGSGATIDLTASSSLNWFSGMLIM